LPNSIFICKFATAKRKRELANPSFAKLQQNRDKKNFLPVKIDI